MMWNEIKTKWKEQNWLKKYLCLVLIAVLVTTQCTQSMGVNLVIAQTSCNSHKEHDETCGYVEAVEGQPCNHTCDETCETSELKCVHSHEDGCSYAEAVEGQDCNHSHSEECGFTQDQETGEDSCTHTHDETCGYVEALDAVDCDHEHTDDCYEFIENHHTHDAECGYVEAVQGVACNHTCSECAPVGELSLTNAVFNINPESEDYKDIEVSFSKGSDELSTIERQTVSDTEDATEREFIAYEKSDDGETVTVTLKKETLEKLEEGEHILYFSMVSGVDLLFRLTVTNLQQEEEAVEEVVEEEVSAASALQTAEVTDGVLIDEEHFPDPEFRKHISENFDKPAENETSGDGVLSKEELDAVTYIDLCSDRYDGYYVSDYTHACKHKCTNLKGIEYFEKLKELYCSNGELASIDISNNTELVILFLSQNNLTKLNISNNQKLESLQLHNNNIEHFDASNHTNLTSLGILGNNLKSLDVSGCESILTLDCCDNQLTSLNVKGLGNLHNLYCDRNQLTSLDLTDNVLLKSLKCYENQLTSLDVSGKSDLGNLQCQDNPLTSLDISGTKLTTLTWEGDQLTSLNASNCTSLTSLTCVNNQLTTLDVTNCTDLTSLDCSSNKLTNLDISTCTALTDVTASGQTLGNLPLYYEKDENGKDVWTNKALNSSERQAVFNENTTFTGGTQANGLDLIDGVLTATANTTGITPQEMTFESKLGTSDAAPVLSGTFTYTMPDKIFVVEYMDVNVAKSLKTPNDLYQYLDEFESAPTPTPFTARTTNYVECPNFDSLNAGIPGYYPVTIFRDGTTYSTAVEVGLDIDYTEDGGGTYVNFPDPEFLKHISENFDKAADGAESGDGFLSKAELDAVTYIDLCSDRYDGDYDSDYTHNCNHKCTNLKGIEYFEKLQELYCSVGQLESLDISNNTELLRLNVKSNLLTKLDISNNQKLKQIDLHNNNIEHFDASNHTDLLTLGLASNNLKSLDVSGCESISTIDCCDNQLTSLNLKGLGNLSALFCDRNQLTSLDLTDNNFLGYIKCYENQLTCLDVSGKSKVWSLECQDNPLTSLNISGTKLTTLTWEGDQLTSLDASNCTSLTSLTCVNNQLTSLDVTNCTALTSLDCSSNKLTNLDISTCSALTTVTASGQTIGNLPLYYEKDENDENGVWVNKALNSSERQAIFNDNTTFTGGEPENNLGLINGVLTATANTTGITPQEMFFESKLGTSEDEDTPVLSGTFTYTMPDKIFVVEYMDVNVAKSLETPNDLYQYFEEIVAPTPFTARTTLNVECSDFDNLNAGMPGYYPVTIFINGTTYSTAVEVGLDIDYTEDGGKTYINFPDSVFREHVSKDIIDKNTDGFLTAEEISAVTGIALVGTDSNRHKAENFKGIEYFTNLKWLQCYYGNLKELDISKNTELKSLDVGVNCLESLDVSKNTKLTYLSISNNYIKNIDVSNNTALTALNANVNELDSLDVSNCTELEELQCHTNNLSELDVSKNTKLKKLSCYVNSLTELDVSNNKNLTELNCRNNKLESLDLSNNSLINSLECRSNKLTNLDISHLTLSFCYCAGQDVETIPLYKDENGTWTNLAADQDIDTARKFATKMLFYNDEAMSEDDKVNFIVDGESQLLTAAENVVVPMFKPVYFTATLTAANATFPMSGTFSYNLTSELSASVVYLDVSEAKALTVENDLAKYFTMNGTAATSESTVTATCSEEDFTAIKTGTPGEYDVTLAVGEYLCTSTVVVGVEINETNFPNENFRTFVESQFDTGDVKDKFLTAIEIDAVTEIDLGGDENNYHSYSSLEGLEHFTSLETLYCQYDNALKSLDLSKNKALTHVYCLYTPALEELDVSGCSALEELKCLDNQNLKRLKLGKHEALTHLNCRNTGLIENLDLSGCPALKDLRCDRTSIQELDVRGCPALEVLTCYTNTNLVSLKLGEHNSLTDLRCQSTRIEELDVSKCPALRDYLYCYSNTKLKSLKLGEHNALTDLRCQSTSIEEIDVSGCPALEELYCGDTNIKELDVSGCPTLKDLRCYGTSIKELDVSRCLLLEQLYCSKTNLRSLDLSLNGKLTYISCDTNPFLERLDVNECSELKTLLCYDCALTELNISNLSLDRCEAYGQTIGTMALYYQASNDGTTGKWVNADKATKYVYSEFNTNTLIYNNATDRESIQGLYVDNQSGLLTADSNKIDSGEGYFESTLGENWALSGTFSYIIPGLTIPTAYVDVSFVQNIKEKTDLLAYFDVSGNSADSTGEIASTDLNITVKTADWNNIQDGVTGTYNVMIKHGAVSADAVLELGVAISETNFPDPEFRDHVARYNTTGEKITIDGTAYDFLSGTELGAVESINLGGVIGKVYHKCGNIKGVEYFTKLRYLNVRCGEITELDLSKNLLLEELICNRNPLTKLDLRANKALTNVNCGTCNLTELYVSGLDKLTSLELHDGNDLSDANDEYNEVTSLDLSGCTSLKQLICYQNQLSYLNISDCTKLEELLVHQNTDLKTLDLSNNTALRNLQCYSNQLALLELNNNRALTYLDCRGNQLERLDLSCNTELITLSCGENKLTYLNIANCADLESLSCSRNNLTGLDVRNNKALQYLYCSNNELTSLEVSGLTSLGIIDCYNDGSYSTTTNKLVSLDVSGLTSLRELSCYDGRANRTLKSLNVTGCTSLTRLSCHIQSLTSLDLSTNPNLSYLNCRSNSLNELDLSNNPWLKTLYCHTNKLTELDLRKNTLLTYLECQNNQLASLNVDGLDLAAFTTLDASNQSVGKLPLYYNDSVWVNEAKNTTEREAVFADGTTFENENVGLNENGNITTASPTLLAGKTIKFTKVLYEDASDSSKNRSLSGSFTVSQPALAVSIGYIDKNIVSDDNIKAAFTVVNNTVDGENITNFSVAFASEDDKTNAKDGVLGQYPVTITSGTNTSSTVLEVGLDIDYFTTTTEEVDGVETTTTTYINFPDEYFRNYLLADTAGFDYEEDGKGFFTLKELNDVTVIDISGTGTSDKLRHKSTNLIGIKYFTNLERLSAGYGKLTSLDVSGMTSLRELSCYENRSLAELKFDGCTSLETLYCYYGNLNSLDVRGLPLLKTLFCYHNNIDGLDLSRNPLLEKLRCSTNPLTTLDVSKNPLLIHLYCNSNNLDSLDISNLSLLTELSCNSNQLDHLDVSNNALLESIKCSGNRLTSLDVSGLRNLTTLEATDQKVGTLGMYYKNGVWVNAPGGATNGTIYVSGKFVDGTSLSKDGNVLGENYFFDAGVFTVKSGAATSMSGISFTSDLIDGNGKVWDDYLTGTFSYEIPDIAVANAYVDVNEVSSATNKDTLANSFTVMTGNQTSPTPDSTASVSIEFVGDEALTSIRQGILGEYPVTLTYTPAGSDTAHTYNVSLELGVEIEHTEGEDYTNFPDVGFRTHVANYDTGLDKVGFLTAKELNAVTKMNLGGAAGEGNGHDCGSLKGINYFANVTSLDCQYGALTVLDVSGLDKLTSLNCSYNTGLKRTADGDSNGTLNVTWLKNGASSNDVLTDLNCDGIGITALDVSTLPNLTKLSCASNDLASLNVSDNEALQELKCSYNEDLNDLDLEENTALTLLYCSGCSLNSLDLTTNTALTELACEYNQIKALNVSHLTNLTSLYCDGNELTSLNIDGLSALESVSATDQHVETILPMSHNGKTWYSTAKLDELDAASPLRTFNTSLTYFYAYEETNGVITPGEELDGFGVNSEGILTIEDLEKGTGSAYFNTNLNNSKGWSLNGTFSYGTDYRLDVNNVFYTSQEMIEEEMSSEADIKGLPKLLTIVPQLDSFKNLVEARLATTTDVTNLEISDTNTFENLDAGTVGLYTYRAQMDNIIGYGQFKVVPTGAVIEDSRASYLYAKSFYIGLSNVADLDDEGVFERATPIFEKYVAGELHTYNTDDAGHAFSVDEAQLSAITSEANTETGAGVGDYSLTIYYTVSNDDIRQITITVHVLNDAPTNLVEIPRGITLENAAGNKAVASEEINLHGDIAVNLGYTVDVTADTEILLTSVDAENNPIDSVTAYVYDEDGLLYEDSNIPLMTLNAEKTKSSFELIADNVDKLKSRDYTGNMTFTIAYRKESDGNEL